MKNIYMKNLFNREDWKKIYKKYKYIGAAIISIIGLFVSLSQTINNSRDYDGSQTAQISEYAEKQEKAVQKAKEVLSEIITEDMTDREKLGAIYDYTKSSITMTTRSDKSNYLVGAYEGLCKKRGDCYTFFATAKLLLSYAGIPNIDMTKNTVEPTHYWNMVYVDGEWLHFDCIPRHNNDGVFLLTTDELAEYAKTSDYAHMYSKTLLPQEVDNK